MNVVTDRGRGAYVYRDSAAEAEKMLGDRFLQVVDLAARAVRLEMTLPWYVAVTKHCSEQSSIDPIEVRPRQLGPNDAMPFFQILHACDASLLRGDDHDRLRATREEPLARRVREAVLDARLDDLAGDDARFAQAAAVAGHAEALVQAHILTGQEREGVLTKALAAVEGGRSPPLAAPGPHRVARRHPLGVSPSPRIALSAGFVLGAELQREAAVATDLGDGARMGELRVVGGPDARLGNPAFTPPFHREDPRPARPGAPAVGCHRGPGARLANPITALGALTRSNATPNAAMAIYEYEILGTDGSPRGILEVEQRMSDPPLTHHPQTGEPLRRILSSTFAHHGVGADASYDAGGCASGTCGLPSYGGCSSGLCGLD